MIHYDALIRIIVMHLVKEIQKFHIQYILHYVLDLVKVLSKTFVTFWSIYPTIEFTYHFQLQGIKMLKDFSCFRKLWIWSSFLCGLKEIHVVTIMCQKKERYQSPCLCQNSFCSFSKLDKRYKLFLLRIFEV